MGNIINSPVQVSGTVTVTRVRGDDTVSDSTTSSSPENNDKIIYSNIHQGYLLTHDWNCIHTDHDPIDRIITETKSPANYQTRQFIITNSAQYQALVNGFSDITTCNKCPAQSFAKGQDDCSPGKLTAVVRIVSQEVHTLTPKKGSQLSEQAKDALKKVKDSDGSHKAVSCFIQQFGSHVDVDQQKFGKCFVWILLINKVCSEKMLKQVAKEIFSAYDKDEDNFKASHHGTWYSPDKILKSSLSDKARGFVKSLRLRISHSGCSEDNISFSDWKQQPSTHHLTRLDAPSKMVPVWELIKRDPNNEHLASYMQETWERLITQTTFHEPAILAPVTEMPIANPARDWDYVVDELGLINYFPQGLQLQTVRTVQPSLQTMRDIQDLPWSVLGQIMSMNAQCREDIINSFAQVHSRRDSVAFGQGAKREETRNNETFIPHPMDMILILYYCSDFILRQVVAQKLFRNRLAIPFIVPTASNQIEILVWPLRSIVMEWRSEDQAVEEALVKSNINMVGFVRYGCENVSKSKTVNSLLPPCGHEVFFHCQAACGKKKRLLANGTVEVTHFLPAAIEDDLFTKPALFLNLRGDACQYPVQHSLVCDLANILVIFLDIANLVSSLVQSRMKHALIKRQQVIAVISNVTQQKIKDVAVNEEKFNKLAGNLVSVVTTYEPHDGSDRNSTEVVMDIREAIRRKMAERPNKSIEQFAGAQHQCLVDENTNQNCKHGKMLAQRVLSLVQKAGDGAKTALLPYQNDSLHNIGKLLRELHRSSGKNSAPADKEAIKTKTLDIRKKQAKNAKEQDFIMQVLALYKQEIPVKACGIKWLQEELDNISRAILPPLQQKRREASEALTRKRKSSSSEAAGSEQLVSLEKDFEKAERELDAATFGMEHLLREMAQICEVEAELKQVKHSTSLPQIVGQLLVEGHPVEMMDGDHGFVPISWLEAVFHSVSELIGEDKRILVISVMGIQSSGKSTLLNTMFNLEFAVSAGRCTRGIFAQLLPVAKESNLKFHYLLILDSEGLRAQGVTQQSYQRDNELATLVIGMADLVLVNLKGENVTEVKDILQIAVQAFLRMKLADAPLKRKCMFIHQNVAAVNATEKLAGERQKLKEQLDFMTEVACQAQDLPQALTSFDQLIEFDADNDVTYFPDLWSGNPPMATCNPRYSLQASKTRQKIFDKVEHTEGHVVKNLVQRVKDMWNGVLADDFVFNFRNGIATKAYNDLEREFSKHLMEIEKEMLQFLNVTCQAEQQKCQTEEELQRCATDQINQLNVNLSELNGKILRKLGDFFETHAAKDIMEQWKAEKEKSLMLALETLRRESKSKLESMCSGRLFEIREQNAMLEHEQLVIAKSKELAEKLRGQDPTQEAMEEEFETMWTMCANDLETSESKQNRCVLDILASNLWEVIESKNRMFLNVQLKKTPLEADSSLEDIPIQSIDGEHFTVRGRPSTAGKPRLRALVAEVASHIMEVVMTEVDAICEQDIMFDAFHGKEVISLTLEEVRKHNETMNSKFSFSPEFAAMLAVRVACCAAPKFEKMNQRYEAKHGVQTRFTKYRQRVFRVFENAVTDATTEVIAATDFCEVIKGQLTAFIRTQLEQKILQEMYKASGLSKYDLIMRILDEIVDNRDFQMLLEYVDEPLSQAERWVHEFGERHIFEQDTPSRYSTFAEHFVKEAITRILSSTRQATKAVNKSPKMSYKHWVAVFGDDVTASLPLNTARIDTKYEIKNLNQYQESIESSLKELETTINSEFKNVTAQSVQWVDTKSPYQHAFEHLWGCREVCPFCYEPCQYTDRYHETAHRCIQHRPGGITGTSIGKSKCFDLTTCNMNVASKTKEFNCVACSYQCRKSGQCNSQGDEQNWHHYRENNKYIPRWDIPPDPACAVAEFWQWAMVTFRAELEERYSGTKLEAQNSWKTITDEFAKSSLRSRVTFK